MASDARAFNFNHLYYFHVVASEGSLARAAVRLRLTEPTISTQIRQLELVLGHRLFNRTSRGLRLTAKGEYAAEHASLMFRASQRMLQGLRPDQAQSRSLSIGVASSVSHTLAARTFVPLFAEGVLVQIRHGDHDYLLRDLLSREIDILLGDRVPAGRAGRSLIAEEIARPAFSVVAPRALARKVKKLPQDLARIPLVLYPPRSRYRWDIERYFADHAIEPRVMGETEDVGIMLSCVQAGTCGAIVPRAQALPFVGRAGLVELGPMNIESVVYASIHRVDGNELVKRAIETLKVAAVQKRSRAG